jgi:hypothetical protein
MLATRRTRAESTAEQDELGGSIVPDTQFSSTLQEAEEDRNSHGAPTEAFSEEENEEGNAQLEEESIQGLTQREVALATEVAELRVKAATLERNQKRQAEVRRREAVLAVQEKEKRRLENQIERIETEEERDVAAEVEQQKRQADEVLEAENRRPVRPYVDPVPLAIYQRAPKTKDLPQYDRKTYQDARIFFDQAEDKWRADRNLTWRTDEEKIDYCILYLDKVLRKAWRVREEEVGRGMTIWKGFVEYMMNSVIDQDNRMLIVTLEYEKVKQGPDQLVTDFVAQLDDLEYELSVTDEEEKRRKLFAKLRPDLLRRMAERNVIPTTRPGLISLARRIEGMDDLFQEEDGHRPSEAKETTTRKPYKSYSNRTEGTPATIVNQVPIGNRAGGGTGSQRTCYNCGKPGHISKECRQGRGPVTCYKCGVVGHYANMCSQLTAAVAAAVQPSGNGTA